jgi:hypothetical protein
MLVEVVVVHILELLLLLEDQVVEGLVEVLQMQLPEHILLVLVVVEDLMEVILLVQTVVLASL